MLCDGIRVLGGYGLEPASRLLVSLLPSSLSAMSGLNVLPSTPVSEDSRLLSLPELSEHDICVLAQQMKDPYGWNETPRHFQLAGVMAQIERIDIMIQAPTGAGKTAIAAGAHLWPLNKGKITIMVSPLMSLEDKMVRVVITYSFFF